MRQTGASSAIDDVTAYVDAAAMATTPAVTHGDIVDMNEGAVQVGSFFASLKCTRSLVECSLHQSGNWLEILSSE